MWLGEGEWVHKGQESEAEGKAEAEAEAVAEALSSPQLK